MTEKKMQIMATYVIVLASLATVAVPDVGAVVYSKESPAQKLRADIGSGSRVRVVPTPAAPDADRTDVHTHNLSRRSPGADVLSYGVVNTRSR